MPLPSIPDGAGNQFLVVLSQVSETDKRYATRGTGSKGAFKPRGVPNGSSGEPENDELDDDDDEAGDESKKSQKKAGKKAEKVNTKEKLEEKSKGKGRADEDERIKLGDNDDDDDDAGARHSSEQIRRKMKTIPKSFFERLMQQARENGLYECSRPPSPVSNFLESASPPPHAYYPPPPGPPPNNWITQAAPPTYTQPQPTAAPAYSQPHNQPIRQDDMRSMLAWMAELADNPTAADTPKGKAVSGAVVDFAVSAPDMFDAFVPPTSGIVLSMMKNGWHVPLTAFTTDMLRQIAERATGMIIKSHARGGSQYVLDTSSLPDEKKMGQEDWHEAWRNLKGALPQVCGPEAVLAFSKHYEHLGQLPWFRSGFSAVLDFDAKARQTWFTADPAKKPHIKVGSLAYQQQLSAARMSDLETRINSISAPRYHPYENDRGGRRGGRGYETDWGDQRRGGRGYETDWGDQRRGGRDFLARGGSPSRHGRESGTSKTRNSWKPRPENTIASPHTLVEDRALESTKPSASKICQTVSRTQLSPQPKRPPVTLKHMHALRAGLDLTNAFDAAVFAIACTAFWGCRRLGELLIPVRNEFDAKRHVARAAQPRFRSIRGGCNYAVLHIPWTKSTELEGADVILTEIDDPTDPCKAMRHHIAASADIPSAAPFFSFKTSNGGWAPMTRDWFLDRCNEVWMSGGLGQSSGHSFRIGGATELLLRGTHPDVVATLGSWSPRAFLEYWRKIEGSLPLPFISGTFDKSRITLVKDTMKDFKRKYCL